MPQTEIFYHGTCRLFDKFSLSFLGEGEGKSKFGQGIYITSSYKTASLYASKAAKANGKDCCYVYTVEVPLLTDDNHIFSCKSVNEDVISLYNRASIIADAQEANYQQALAGITCNIISMAIYLSRNRDFDKQDIASQINLAKAAVHENISTITPTELAEITCVSYSKFRKMFKEYTGFAPSQYIQEVRINMAKELLTNTAVSIKEIAYELGYENTDYFFTVFKRVTGMTPVNYRIFTQGRSIVTVR